MSKLPLLLFLTLPVFAQSVLDGSHNYIFVQVGDLNYEDSDHRFQYMADNVFALGEEIASLDWSDEAFRLTEGFHLNKYLAVEGTLNVFGESTATTTSGQQLEARHLGLAMHLAGKYRFHRLLTAFGLIGGQYWVAETKLVGVTTDPHKVTRESANISWGFGAYAEVTETILVRLDWHSSRVDTTDYSMTSLGMGISF